MDTGRITATASALLAIASFFVSVYCFEGAMAALSVFALVFGIVASRHCSASTNRIILLAGIALMVCTLLSVTVLNQGDFSDENGHPSTFWFVLIGLVHTVPVVPLTMSSFTVIASVTGASYNWAVVRGLSPFIGMGMLVPGFVLEYMFEGADNWMTDNGYILYHFLMTALVMIVFSYLVSVSLRRSRMIITENGLEELKC